jgi:hypothetical protein
VDVEMTIWLHDRVADRADGANPGKVIACGLREVLVEFDDGGQSWVNIKCLKVLPKTKPVKAVIPGGTDKATRIEPSHNQQRQEVPRMSRVPPSAIRPGWAVKHKQYGWGIVISRAGAALFIDFGVARVAVTESELRKHLEAVSQKPKPGAKPLTMQGSSSSGIRGPAWSNYRFGTPNTKFWRR